MKNKIKILMAILLIIILFLICFFINNITLIGNSEITVNVFDSYNDLGTTKKHVKVNGKVDTNKLGNYKITYKNGIFKKTRIVRVIDNEKPKLTLIGNSEVYLYLGSSYVDYGATAVDNYDGIITDNITLYSDLNSNKNGDYIIKYTVKDSSNNETSVVRNIHVIENGGNYKSIPVLMYHFFYDSSIGEVARDSNWIDVSKFEQQVKYLVDNSFYFPTWQEILDYLDKKIKLPDKSIVITVDDGDPSFFKLGVPILEKYNAKATSFMITSWYQPENYNYDKNIIFIESHSHNMHRGGCDRKGIFQCISEEEAIIDLKQSIDVTKSSMVFCYPFGHINDREKSILKTVGFKMAFTTVSGKILPGMDKLELPRVRISGTNSIDYFIKSVN